MTESEWLGCTDPVKMLNWLRGEIPRFSRKMRLFGCACCERIGHLLTDARSRKAFLVAESFADGYYSEEELAQAENDATLAHKAAFEAKGKRDSMVEWVAAYLVNPSPFHAAKTVQWMVVNICAYQSNFDVKNQQADLMREIFGNPFRPLKFDSLWLQWNGGKLVQLARAIYYERSFNRLPELGKELTLAGCQEQSILDHCLQPGIHVRGCWVLDLVLGKG